MKKYIFAIISFILALISINTVYAATTSGWGFDVKRSNYTNVYDCNSSRCDVSLNARADNINDSTFYYWSADQTNMSANGPGNMWTYLVDTPLSKDYLYSITSYVCSLNYSANLFLKDYYSSGSLANVYNKVDKGTSYFTQSLSNLNSYPYTSSDGAMGSCSYFTTIYKPSVNSKYVGVNFTVDMQRNNFASAFIGYKVDSLGLANNLSTSDIQNIIGSSGLASSSDINSLNTSITNIQNQLANNISSAENSINNNIDDAEANIVGEVADGVKNITDNLAQESQNIQNGIKDGFEDCRDSVNLLKITGGFTPSGVSYSLSDDTFTLNGSNSSAYGISIYLNNRSELTLKANKTYSISVITNGSLTSSGYRVFYFYVGGSSISLGRVPLDSSVLTYVYTPTQDVVVDRLLLDMSPGSLFSNYSIKIQIQEGSTFTSYEKYGEKICKNRIDSTNEKLDDLNGSLNNSDTSGANNDAGGFFNNFSSSNNGGISSIITAPLVAINAMLDNTCTPLTATYKGKTITLPCGYDFWSQMGEIQTYLNWFEGGIFAYLIIRKLYKLIDSLKNPDEDRIEVMSL